MRGAGTRGAESSSGETEYFPMLPAAAWNGYHYWLGRGVGIEALFGNVVATS